jgi:microcystin degradation protein MlrC
MDMGDLGNAMVHQGMDDPPGDFLMRIRKKKAPLGRRTVVNVHQNEN